MPTASQLEYEDTDLDSSELIDVVVIRSDTETTAREEWVLIDSMSFVHEDERYR